MSSTTWYSLGGSEKGLKLETAQDVAPYLTEMEKLGTQLNEIRLGGNTLGVGACEALGEWLGKRDHIKYAKFDDIFTGRLITEIPQCMTALCKGLSVQQDLVELDFSDNALGERVIDPICDFISLNYSVQHLKISNNGLGPIGGSRLAKAITQCALFRQAFNEKNDSDKAASLKTIVCARNRLQDGSMKDFAEALRTHGTLERIEMYQNGISKMGIKTLLLQGLAHNLSLKYLDLQDNTFTQIGCRAIASSLPFWTKLEHLNIADCLLRPSGARAFALALAIPSTTPNLLYLNLQSNELDHSSIPPLTDAIISHIHKIKTLDLDGNRVDSEDEVLAPLRDALEKVGCADALVEIEDVEEGWEDEEEILEDLSEEEKEESEEEAEIKEEKKVQEDKEVDKLAEALGSKHIA